MGRTTRSKPEPDRRARDYTGGKPAGSNGPAGMTTTNEASTGTIKKLIDLKGFGFIVDDTRQAKGVPVEYFFHFSSVVGGQDQFSAFREGQKVSFKIGDTLKGPRAFDVEPRA